MKTKLEFQFVIPLDSLLSTARDNLESEDQDIHAVSKAILDHTSESIKIRDAIIADEHVYLAPYVDFWFGDSISAANRLLNHQDESIRLLSKCLIDQEQAALLTKMSFLAEMNRLGAEPNHTD
jgi:hypothetical protein